MTERPRLAILAYGSILDPEDLVDLFGTVTGRVRPVVVSGFRRVFNQEASWRETDDGATAVLNVERSRDDWFNAVLVADVERAAFRKFRDRERGYRLTEVDGNAIDPYPAGDVDSAFVGDDPPVVAEQDLVLVPIGKKVRSDVSPIGEYVDICRAGAREWGEQFYADFLRSTELASGETLAERVDVTDESPAPRGQDSRL